MKKLGAILLAVVSLAVALPTAQPAAGPDIRLVLLIAVDQFRYDYLTRFRTEYTGGIKRLLTEGAVFTNANLEHYPTVTAVGHATMLSGATPSVSGIIGNDWFDRETGATVTSVSDPTVKPLGSATDVGGVAPAAAGEHAWRRTEDGVAAAKGRRRRAARIRRVLERSIGDPARRPRRRCRLLVGYDDRQLRDEHVLRSLRLPIGCGPSTSGSRRTPTPARRGPRFPRRRPRSDSFPPNAGLPSTTRSTAAHSATNCSSTLPASCWAVNNSARATPRICSPSASRRTIRSAIPMGRIRRRCGTSPSEPIGP